MTAVYIIGGLLVLLMIGGAWYDHDAHAYMKKRKK